MRLLELLKLLLSNPELMDLILKLLDLLKKDPELAKKLKDTIE